MSGPTICLRIRVHPTDRERSALLSHGAFDAPVEPGLLREAVGRWAADPQQPFPGCIEMRIHMPEAVVSGRGGEVKARGGERREEEREGGRSGLGQAAQQRIACPLHAQAHER